MYIILISDNCMLQKTQVINVLLVSQDIHYEHYIVNKH